jgi:hypothetical protein
MPRCRPFKLVDGMVLIATMAAWMALMRPLWDQHQAVWIATRKAIPWQSYVGVVQSGLSLFLWMLTIAYLVIRLIRPRPLGSDLIRQPGMLLLWVMIGILMSALFVSMFVPLVAWTNIVIALALALSWFFACHRHRSRAEPGWIERLGISLGVGWIITTATAYPLYLLFYR